MALTEDEKQKLKVQLQELDDSLRVKYMEIVKSLSLEDLKKFNKHHYKSMLKSKISDLLPEVDKKSADDTAQYISNMLNNEAQRQKSLKSRVQSKAAQTRRTRHSLVRNSEEAEIITTDNKQTNSEDIKSNTPADQQCSETFIMELDNTLLDADDTLSSTISTSQMDDTYETVLDDSITELKSVAQTKDKTKKEKKKDTNKHKYKKKKHNETSSDNTITCIDDCTINGESSSIRCNFCMEWFQTDCVGIPNVDDVAGWVCTSCRVLPKTVSHMKSQMEILIESTKKIFETVNTLSKRMENNFTNLNDRLTALSNQNKHAQQSGTESLSDINHEISDLKTEVDRKTNVILSKTQNIFEKVKVTADLVSSKQSDNLCIKSTNKSSLQGTSNDCTRDIGPNSSKVPTSNHTENQKNKPKPLEPVTKINHEKQNLTFITGSCILKNIETRFLDENVRIKSFRKAKIENLKDSLTQMDLSRYKNIILHIGGHDVDSGISQTSFREKYLNLLECMKQQNCKTYVSGLLP